MARGSGEDGSDVAEISVSLVSAGVMGALSVSMGIDCEAD
jgi:hypothetical protein